MDLAIQYTGGLFDLHNYGRELLMDNKVDQALNIFNINAKKHPNHWVSQLGLARGYAASGDTKRALKYAKNAQKMIPNEEMGVRKYAVNLLIEQLNKNEKPVIFLATDWKQVY